MKTYYFYRYTNINCSEIKLLGTFETSLDPIKLWDILFQLFCADGEGGMFMRGEPIE